MNRMLASLSLGVVWVACFLAAGAEDATAPKTTELLTTGKEPVRVVCLGDSVTGVYYHTGGRRAYPEMLEVALKRLYPGAPVSVINAGISGNTTIDGLKRLESDVLAHKPNLVTVMFGLNDMTRVPMEDYEANLATIIQKCRDSGAEVLLCTPNSVTDTPGRPIPKLLEYMAGMKRVGERTSTGVADCYAACEAFHAKDPFGWVMMMSDEIHPSMTGHKLVAVTIAQAATGKVVSLDDEGPLQPAIPKTLALLKEGKPVKIHAMPPYDRIVAESIKALVPQAQLEITPWNIEGQTLAQIEEGSKAVRGLKPDFVVVAVPVSAASDSKEQFVRSYKWVLNYALSFGHQEWDCIAIPPSVTDANLPDESQERDRLARDIIWAQDLGMVDRATGDSRPAAEIFKEWLRKQMGQ